MKRKWNLRVLSYSNKEEIITIDEKKETLLYLHVHVVSGDEIVTAFCRRKHGDNVIRTYFVDHGGRMFNFDDGYYLVAPEDVDRWNERKDAYEGLDGHYCLPTDPFNILFPDGKPNDNDRVIYRTSKGYVAQSESEKKEERKQRKKEETHRRCGRCRGYGR